MSYIELKDVKKIYKMGEVNINALSGVNFSVEKGEFVIIAGASGAGKSTILNILGGMDTPTSGEIIVDGCNISNFNPRQLTTYRRYDIGFVFQFYNLVQNLTVRENIEMATQICKNPLDIDEVIKAVGLEERKTNFPAQLSGGEQQRVAIARALAKDAPIVLLDEATASLDPENEVLIQSAISELVFDKTVIIVAHRLQSIMNADQIVVLDDGNVRETGTHTELLEKDGMYAHLWQEQSRAGNWSIK